MFKKVNRDRFFPTSKRQNFIFPRVLVESTKYRGCWRMKYAIKNNIDYYVQYEGEMWFPGRLSYHLNVKNIPRQAKKHGGYDGTVRHSCGHKWCVNPAHLYMFNAGELKRYKRLRDAEKAKVHKWQIDPTICKSGPKTGRRNWQKERRAHGNRGRPNIGVDFWHLMRKTIYWGA